MTTKWLVIAVFFAVFFVPLNVSAASDHYDYSVTSFDVNMVVYENNSFDIIENIGVYFNVPKHGILRKLPLTNEIVRLDGTKSRNRAKISDIDADEHFTTYNKNGNRIIKIGDPERTLTGIKNYSIRYKYDIGRDTGKGYDELYFNLVGGDWDTTISNISFTITMPKSFDQSKLGFSAGTKTSTDNQLVSYTVNGNVITGRYDGTLNPHEYVTVRLELPDGYFVNTRSNFDFLMVVTFILPILFVLCYFIVWLKHGVDDKVVETVEFYPPEGFNSAEIGFIYKGSVEAKDIVSLLIYLANKGYITIVEFEKKTLFSTAKSFKITKVKDYDGDNVNEEIFLKGLFISKDEVTDIDLYNQFYTTIYQIVANLNNKENKRKIFEENSLNKGIFGIVMAIITFVLITVRPILDTSEPVLLIFALLFPGIGFSIMILALLGGVQTKGEIIALLIFGTLFGGIPWCLIVFPTLLLDTMYLVAYLIGLACIVGISVLLKYMPKRTPYGNELLGRIRGFKNFLEIAEKEKLEELVVDDPEYFYNILPYTYVLGVSDKWIKKFETIVLQAPTWYHGADAFSTAGFSSFMNSTMTSASSSMTSSPSSSSGGGSSGGGSGGGGGSSW